MSVFTKQVRAFTESLWTYLTVFFGWIMWTLVLVGLTRRAWGGDSASFIEVLFIAATAACSLWCGYYGWLQLHLWVSRNRAGAKREILESQADAVYRPRVSQ